MRTIRQLLLVVFLTCLCALTVCAEGFVDYSEQAFKAAQASGKTVVLDFHASWCPTCKRQKPVLEALLKQPEYKSFLGFTVDFDNSDELQKALSVRRQSTVIVFKGTQEVGRSIGDTSKEDLEPLIKKGL